ncbi:MAG: peptidoglycan editing factor PgeF [Myxococcaceae bacterium]
MELITSVLLPVPHGFSTREGGVSEGPFASLNLGFSVGDRPEAVETNLRRIAARAEVSPSRLLGVSQVHGVAVVHARAPVAGDTLTPPLGEADALWTEDQDTAVGVKTADCVPILLADPRSKRVAAVHSGWRGTDFRISERAAESLGAASGIVAAIGPCIRECCYEVSDELAHRFASAFGPEVTVRRGARWHLNLVAAVRESLRAAGLSADRIDSVPALCTSCDPRRFYSHRRDGGRTGRHLSFVVCRF